MLKNATVFILQAMRLSRFFYLIFEITWTYWNIDV